MHVPDKEGSFNCIIFWTKYLEIQGSLYYDNTKESITLVRLIMTGNIVKGKNNGGYKYGGIAEKLPNLATTILPVI